MKKTVVRAVCAALVFSLLFTLGACSKTAGIRKTVAAFQKACNELNVEAAVACLDPSVADVLNLGAGLIGAFTGQSNEEIFGTLSGILVANADSFGMESFSTLKIRTTDVAANDSTADAKVTLIYTDRDGAERKDDVTLRFRRSEDGAWLISGVSFQ